MVDQDNNIVANIGQSYEKKDRGETLKILTEIKKSPNTILNSGSYDILLPQDKDKYTSAQKILETEYEEGSEKLYKTGSKSPTPLP